VKHYDVIVIGGGPAGQKAAVQAAKCGRRVALIEQLKEVGGACVHQGTIPSKALRERALERRRVADRLRALGAANEAPITDVGSLIGEMTEVIRNHDLYMAAQMKRNAIEVVHGRASFLSSRALRVRFIDGREAEFSADHFVIATGSKPRHPSNVPIDHEAIYDSDSILSLAYLPASLVVLGGGVIASEYASIFAVLGVEVTMIDRAPTPLGFLEPEMVQGFLTAFARDGGRFIGDAVADRVEFDGVSRVRTRLADGRVVDSDKLLCALGRISQLDGLHIERAGVTVSERQLVEVNEFGQTSVPHIYAAGDVIGPPSLASAAMEQGRRAACHLLGIDPGNQGEWIPSGIYSVPEIASVGLTTAETRARYGGVVIGFAKFDEIARGHIARCPDGLLKMLASPDGVVRGVHIIGDNATDLVHIGQMGLIHSVSAETYVENVFNFPTFAECYRVAALQITGQLSSARARSAGRLNEDG
jgi:NAD(P) transhydrogenase